MANSARILSVSAKIANLCNYHPGKIAIKSKNKDFDF
jgi:hypothetical protein